MQPPRMWRNRESLLGEYQRDLSKLIEEHVQLVVAINANVSDLPEHLVRYQPAVLADRPLTHHHLGVFSKLKPPRTFSLHLSAASVDIGDGPLETPSHHVTAVEIN